MDGDGAKTMASWTPQDWAMFLTAVGTFLTAIIAAVGAFLANMAKVRGEQNTKAIDANTSVTVAGTAAAATNAHSAKIAAKEAKAATESIVTTMNQKLNGGIDSAIEEAIKPLRKIMDDHAAQDDANMKEICNRLEDLGKRVR